MPCRWKHRAGPAVVALFTSAAGLAHAGLGTSYLLGRDTTGGSQRNNEIFAELSRFPTVDVHSGHVVLQVHFLNAMVGVIEGETRVGANLFFSQQRRILGHGWQGELGPGISCDFVGDLDFDPLTMLGLALFRAGVMREEAWGFGLFIVPGVGVSLTRGRARTGLSGTLQFSVWIPAPQPAPSSVPEPPIATPDEEASSPHEPRNAEPPAQGSDAPTSPTVEPTTQEPAQKRAPAIPNPEANGPPRAEDPPASGAPPPQASMSQTPSSGSPTRTGPPITGEPELEEPAADAP